MTFSEGRRRHLVQVSSYVPAFEWLKENAEDECVVVSGPETASWITSFTPCRSFIGHYAFKAAIRQDELVERAFSTLQLYQLGADRVRWFEGAHPLLFWGYSLESRLSRERILNILRGWTGRKPFDRDQWRRDQIREMEQRSLIRKPNLPWESYRATYVIYGPWEKELFPNFEPDRYPRLKKIDLEGGVGLWSVFSAPPLPGLPRPRR